MHAVTLNIDVQGGGAPVGSGRLSRSSSRSVTKCERAARRSSEGETGGRANDACNRPLREARQRVGLERTRLKLGMELYPYEPGIIAEFDRLWQDAVGQQAGIVVSLCDTA